MYTFTIFIRIESIIEINSKFREDFFLSWTSEKKTHIFSERLVECNLNYYSVTVSYIFVVTLYFIWSVVLEIIVTSAVADMRSACRECILRILQNAYMWLIRSSDAY